MSGIALITGANRGLGFAVARALATVGHTVIIAGRDESRAREAAAQLCAAGLAAEWLVLDVTSPPQAQHAAEQVRHRHGSTSWSTTPASCRRRPRPGSTSSLTQWSSSRPCRPT